MSDDQGKFVWYELMTTDTDAAESFYHQVIGWDTKEAGLAECSYTILSKGEHMIGGLMHIPEEACAAGAKPSWCGYIAVDDVDIYTERVKQAGGKVYRDPDDIESVGRFSVVADPCGAAFILFKSFSAPQAPVMDNPSYLPGHIGWHELYTDSIEKAFSFYEHLFGWTKHDAIDMGPLGTYQIFAINGKRSGGMMVRTSNIPVSFWSYYFSVDEIKAALARVRLHGGKIIHGPQQVPSGVWIAQCVDPQGVMFAMVSTQCEE